MFLSIPSVMTQERLLLIAQETRFEIKNFPSVLIEHVILKQLSYSFKKASWSKELREFLRRERDEKMEIYSWKHRVCAILGHCQDPYAW